MSTKKKKGYTQAEMEALAELRIRKIAEARETIIPFAQLNHPSPVHPEDVEQTRYAVAPHHELIAEAFQDLEAGKFTRLIINLPPRAGKSELVKQFIAWFWGRDPYRQTIYTTYNQHEADKAGRNVRRLLLHNHFRKQCFPAFTLDSSTKSASMLMSMQGGELHFLGAGSGLTGKGADLLVIDDPLKGREEANSKTERDKLWNWFWSDAHSRLMPEGRVVLIQTRWHEDDLTGRLTDPNNEFYNPEVASRWKVLSFPALMDDPDTGEKECIELWEGRWGVEVLRDIKRANPKDFYSLYQQSPTVDDGDFFKDEWLRTYSPNELPHNLRIYAASDHAVSTTQRSDSTVLLVVGIDEADNIYVLDCWWRKAQTDVVVDAMLHLMRKHRPLWWYAENGHISKSIGPFLRKRMQEERCYVAIREMTPAKDKETRAQSIQGRMSMGKVFFPRFAPWWPDAKNELLKFPSGTHDDFVDALAWIGLGVDYAMGAPAERPVVDDAPKVGTLAWVKWAADQERRSERARKFGGI